MCKTKDRNKGASLATSKRQQKTCNVISQCHKVLASWKLYHSMMLSQQHKWSCLRHDKNMMMHIFWRQGFKKIWYFSLFPPFGIKYQTRFALSYPRSSNTNKTLDRGIISSGLWLDKSRNYDLNSFLICNSETSIGFTQKFRSAVRDIAPDSEIPIRHRLVYSSDFGICEGLCQSF